MHCCNADALVSFATSSSLQDIETRLNWHNSNRFFLTRLKIEDCLHFTSTHSCTNEAVGHALQTDHLAELSSKGWAYLLSDCDAFDVGAKVNPQRQQAWQGLEDWR